MKRDLDIQKVFEIADDSLQGVIGYYFYVRAIQKAVEIDKVHKYLPPESFQMTLHWKRHYRKQDLIDAFTEAHFEFLQSRFSLISTINIFDVALRNLVLRLRRKGCGQLQRESIAKISYRKLLKWAFKQSMKCDIGNKETLGSLPKTMGIIDNARRLRNLIVHNRGLFSDRYERDVIRSCGVIPDFHPLYEVFKANPRMLIPVIIDSDYFHRLILAHVELLHVLHNYIQKEYFGVSKGYSYAEEGKSIDWIQILWGGATVQISVLK